MWEINSIPDAPRTFTAIRNLGYDFNASVADLLDNALASKVQAKNIDITFKRVNGKYIFRMQDDGKGMSGSHLEEAMRIGSRMENYYGPDDLGKYGMGLKTASLAHCNILTVISKTGGGKVVGYSWNMHHVNKKMKWHLLQMDREEIKKLLKKSDLKEPSRGTIVMWDDLYLLDEEYDRYEVTQFAENNYFKILGELKLYLGMVFHRFLDGQLGKNKTIKLKINDKAVKPWDPFCTTERETMPVTLSKKDANFIIPEQRTPIIIKGYVLPTKEKFSSKKAWEAAKGLLSWNEAQGYYIYRANRIVRFGGWHGTRALDEHDKYARISIDIDPKLDNLFKITVNKNRVEFPRALWHHLKDEINIKVVKAAKQKYNKSDERPLVGSSLRKENSGIVDVAEKEMNNKNLTTKAIGTSVVVNKKGGGFKSNLIDDFLNHGNRNDYEIVSESLPGETLYKLFLNEGKKWKLIVNANHPFHEKFFDGKKGAFVGAVDALLFSAAFAELLNRRDDNANMFESFRSDLSRIVRMLVKKEII